MTYGYLKYILGYGRLRSFHCHWTAESFRRFYDDNRQRAVRIHDLAPHGIVTSAALRRALRFWGNFFSLDPEIC